MPLKDSARGRVIQLYGGSAVKRSGAAHRLEGRDRVRWLQERFAPIAGEPRVCFENAARIATNTDHHACVVPGAAEQQREHRGAAEAAVAPDSPAAMQNAVDVKGEQRGRHAFAARGHTREPREGLISLEKLERARHGSARRHDLELGSQPHASERRRRSPRATATHHFPVYEGTFASAETSK